MKKLRIVTLIILISTVIGLLGFVYLSTPLVFKGSSSVEYSNGDKNTVFDFYNEGISKVLIKEVLINNKPSNGIVDLGISYDTLQFVQSGTDNELIRFYELGEAFVIPKIKSDELQDALDKKAMTPFHYGIRVKRYKEPINTITIKYQYLAFPVTKEIIVNSK